MAFDIDRFVEDCRQAVKQDNTHKSVRALVERALSDRGALIAALGEPSCSQVQKIHADDDLTIINVVWGPKMSVSPHNHEMWAVIGMYTGREDNVFWRKIKEHPEGRIEAAGAASLCEGDAHPLGPDIVHSVLNPLRRFTGAIHVYGGNFFEKQRCSWDSETLVQEPYSLDKTLREFEDGNAMARVLL